MIAQTTELTGIVAAANERGLRLHEEADWRNVSKYAKPTPQIPEIGARVRLTLDGSGWIRAIATLADEPSPQHPVNALQQRAAQLRAAAGQALPDDEPPSRAAADLQRARSEALGHAIAAGCRHPNGAIDLAAAIEQAEIIAEWILRP